MQNVCKDCLNEKTNCPLKTKAEQENICLQYYKPNSIYERAVSETISNYKSFR